MIETVTSKTLKELEESNNKPVEERQQEQQQMSDEKTKETNVLFEQLPTYYNDEDESESDETDSEEDEEEEATNKSLKNNNTISIENEKSITIITTTTKPRHRHESISELEQQQQHQQSVKMLSMKKARVANNNGTATTTTTLAYSLDCKMNQVLPRLYISDDIIARNKSMLVKYKITHILNLTTNIPNKFEPDITYLKIIIFDFETQNISQYFSESFEFIENALKQDEQNRVLVHCNAGISRSASFVIAYLLQKRVFKRYKDAYNHLKKARPVIEPNRGFEKQLINFEKRIRKNKGCSIM